jgi:hypothetical protein
MDKVPVHISESAEPFIKTNNVSMTEKQIKRFYGDYQEEDD